VSEKNKTIAEKTAKLNELVAWFEGDNFVLEEALTKYAEAEKLAAEIEDDLKALKNDIETVKAKFSEA
jgi:exodeoxyribonuclease VII small subunit